VIRGWKARAETGDMYLKNYLFERLGHRLTQTEHTLTMFKEATDRVFPILFNEDPPDE
jgi:hypothetical protein